MKYLFNSLFAFSLLAGISSCTTSSCYECTHPVACDVNICSEQVTTANSCSSGGSIVMGTGSTNDEFKIAYEAEGYTCVQK